MTTGADASPGRPSRPPPGGPAALAGFLYQLLGSADWAVRARFGADGRRGGAATRLILEPARGGDARHGGEAIQFKRRGRPWTVTSLVREVFPDLFQALGDETVSNVSLQTDASYGDEIASLTALAEALREGELDEALEQADRSGLRLRFGRARAGLAPADFFAAAGAMAAGVTVATFERDPALRARFRTLLATLRLQPARTPEAFRAAIEARLRAVLPHIEDTSLVAGALLAEMAIHAAEGDAVFELDAFLATQGVTLAAAAGAAAFARNLRERFESAMTRLGYDEAVDCREAAPLTPSPQPTAISGISGAGKTWLLARAASAAAERGVPVLWLENITSVHEVASRIADAVQAARGVTRAIHGDAVGDVLAAIAPEAPPGLLVCLDRFSDPATALGIFQNGWWLAQRVMVMGALPACDPGLIAGDGVKLVAAPVFTAFEVRRLLHGRSLSWATLPSDVRQLLERPLMASLYAGLGRPADGGFVPTNEYELMEAVWARSPRDAHGGCWRAAVAKLDVQLDRYRQVLQSAESPAYPWSVTETAWDSQERDVLERQGLLRWADESHLRVDHDRLLAWGIARSAANAWRRGDLSAAALTTLLERCGARFEQLPPGGSALGYVLADFLWLVCLPREEPREDLLQVLRGLNRRRDGWEWPTLATLGERGFKLILRMAERFDDEAIGSSQAAGRALAACSAASLAPADEAAIAALLERSDRRDLAAAYHVRRPNPAALLRLIQLRAELYPFPEDTGRVHRWHAQRIVLFEAAQSCALAAPNAFIGLLPRLQTGDEITVAAWIAAELPPSHALRAWRRLGDAITGDRLTLIARFAGLKLDARAEALLSAQASTDSSAFATLARVRPDAALALVRANPLTGLDELDELARTRPQVLAAVAGKLSAGEIDADVVVRAALGWSAWVSLELAQAILGRLDPAADNERALQLLAEAPSAGVLVALEGEAGSAFERGVQADALRRSADHLDRNRDWVLGHDAAVLLRIGAEGFEALTAARIRHPFDLEVRDGLDAALVMAGPDVVAAVLDHARATLEASRGGSIPLQPFDVLSAVAPDAAGELARDMLSRPGREEALISAEIALRIEDAQLALASLSRFGDEASEDIIYKLRILDLGEGEPGPRAALARRLLATGESHDRLYAAWTAWRLGDAALLAEVADRLVEQLNGSYESVDLRTGAVLLTTELGPRVLAALKAPNARRRLRSLRAGLDSPELDDAVSDINLDLRDATALEDSFLNIPREGLARLWRVDEEAAFEIFDEGLRRGGRTSEGAAAAAFQADPSRALAIVLKRLAEITDAKARLDAGRATRAYAEASKVVAERLQATAAGERLAAAELAGWLADPALDAQLDAILRTETRHEIRQVAHTALQRSARLRFLAQLEAFLAEASDTDARRRLMAIALSVDVDHVLSQPDDPLYVGRWIKSHRDRLLVAAWTRS